MRTGELVCPGAAAIFTACPVEIDPELPLPADDAPPTKSDDS
jgi:hypothetical protein